MKIFFLHHFGVWILIIIAPFGHLQQVIITRLDGNQGPVCPGQRLSFQCTTVGSTGIAWRSTDFIGSSIVQIGFFDDEPLSTPKTSVTFPDTVAVLASKDSGVLTSILTVTVTSVNLNPSVTCINEDHNNQISFSFNVIQIGAPGVPATDENPVLREDTQGSCILTISWTAVANITHYIVSINATLEINETLTFTSVVVPECRSYSVRIQSVNQCGDKSPYSPEILPDTENIRPPIFFDSPDSLTTDYVPVCTNPPREECDDCSRLSTGSIVVIVIAVLFSVTVLIILIVTVVLIKLKKDSKDQGSECCSAMNKVSSSEDTDSKPENCN